MGKDLPNRDDQILNAWPQRFEGGTKALSDSWMVIYWLYYPFYSFHLPHLSMLVVARLRWWRFSVVITPVTGTHSCAADSWNLHAKRLHEKHVVSQPFSASSAGALGWREVPADSLRLLQQ
jgi:hypothetical protein